MFKTENRSRCDLGMMMVYISRETELEIAKTTNMMVDIKQDENRLYVLQASGSQKGRISNSIFTIDPIRAPETPCHQNSRPKAKDSECK